MSIRVGIFFGGPSREREISFAGGRTVFDNLDQSLFTPIPIFVDSDRHWVMLDWHYVYKGSIRDFFPPVQSLPDSPNGFQVYIESLGTLAADERHRLLSAVGTPVTPEEIAQHIDLAFLALHGEYGEDGQLQQALQTLGIPYTGSGVLPSKIGMNKAWQKELMQEKGFDCPTVQVIEKPVWLRSNVHELYEQAIANIGFPLVIRPANQGSSIGVSIIDEEAGVEGFEQAVNRAFFRELIPMDEWNDRSDYDKVEYIKFLGDIRDGLGFPLTVTLEGQQTTVYHPEDLLALLNTETDRSPHFSRLFVLDAAQTEQQVILEAFIKGQEFSCIVIRTEDGSAVALPPTEIIKGSEVFDYRSKYMPGLSRKETPINLPDEKIEAIRRECERLFTRLGFQVYARIDGFFTPEGKIFLNDPNTTSGMLPSSFFFHQAAEIGLNPSQFLTYIVRTSLQERLAEEPDNSRFRQLLQQLDANIAGLRQAAGNKKKIAVILGGYSFERHISVESGRNIFEKLSSSIAYEPIPVFLTGADGRHELTQLPINLLLKDNADDIRDKIKSWKSHPLLEKIRRECATVTGKYASPDVVFSPVALTYDSLSRKVDGVFIALHGRPGEDGQVQMELEARGLPYNGSGIKSSSTTIDKYRTLQTLQQHGLPVAKQLLLPKNDYVHHPARFLDRVEDAFGYPLVAKPVDDGCSSAVKVIRNREQLQAYCDLIFSLHPEEEATQRKTLKLKTKEEFSRKGEILFEELVVKGDGIHFLEVTGGMLTHYEKGKVRFEMFEPSETLASGEVLSLEEKFLAGEGQNLTPARLATGAYRYEDILPQVQHTLERAARLLQVEGYCRIDAFVRVLPDGKAETQVIEINSLPGMTPATAIFHQAALAGYKPAAFIKKILEFGFERQAAKAVAAPAIESIPVQPPPPLAQEVMATAAPVALFDNNNASTDNNMDSLPTDASPSNLPPRRFHHFLAALRSRYFIKNFGAVLAVLVMSFLLLNLLLRLYTNHGSSVQVENFVGQHIDKATQQARSRGFRVSVNEAPFDLSVPQGEVIDQEPEPLNRIKSNRTVYLTIIGDPREVPIPSFQDAADDYSQYRQKLRPLQIRTVVKEGVFDAKLADSTILFFYYQGKKYTPDMVRKGMKVLQGSTLEFVVSKSKDDMVRIPSLMCKRYSEVSFLLSGLDLSLGEVEGEVANRSDAYIWKQEPEYVPGGKIMRGTKIKVYIQSERPNSCPPEEETNEPPSDTGGLPVEDLDSPIDTSGIDDF
ncbi:MAG: PASTA domain-containing protein [Saprospiraceae bacterium]